MTYDFDHRDAEGDRVTLMKGLYGAPDEVAIIHTSRDGAYLTRDAVDRLRAALAPYGTAEAVKPADIVRGREYRLLPRAETLPGVESSAVADRVTRVRVVNPDSGYRNGTTRVKGLDGRAGGYIVMPKYLAPLTEEPATEAQPAPLDPRWMAALRLARELRPTDSATGLRDFARLVLAEVTR